MTSPRSEKQQTGLGAFGRHSKGSFEERSLCSGRQEGKERRVAVSVKKGATGDRSLVLAFSITAWNVATSLTPRGILRAALLGTSEHLAPS
uniref:Uncharacterized protein n=1 Tax=Steinernema glaseri TaxID=37863 RepID=A0A1I7Y6F9_9BILA